MRPCGFWKPAIAGGGEIARELGIRRNQLYKWQERVVRHRAAAFPGSGRRARSGDELARLKRVLERVKEERDIQSLRYQSPDEYEKMMKSDP